MNTLISGHLGFIGSHLISKLSDWHGYDLTVGQDITDRLRLYNTFEQGHYDVVIHLAALTSVKRGELFPTEMIKTNIQGTYNIIEMCQKFNVKRLIFFSSSSVLGGNTDIHAGLNEEAPYSPISMYGITKTAAELLVKNSGLEYVIIRPFSVYGPAGRQDQVFYRWIHQIKNHKPITFYGNGQTARGYTYVKDLVDATIKLATADHKLWRECKNKIIHLGGETVITLADLKDIFEDYCTAQNLVMNIEPMPIPTTDIQYSYADVSLAKKLLGYQPTSNFAEIVTEILAQEFNQNPKDIAWYTTYKSTITGPASPSTSSSNTCK